MPTAHQVLPDVRKRPVCSANRPFTLPPESAPFGFQQPPPQRRGSRTACPCAVRKARAGLGPSAEDAVWPCLQKKSAGQRPIPGRCRWQPPGISAMSHCVLGILCGLPKKAPARTAGARGPERWPVWRRIYSFTISMAFAWVLPVALRGMATCSTPFLQRAVMASTSASSGRANTRWKEPYVRSSTCWLF